MSDRPRIPKPEPLLLALEPLATPGKAWEAYLIPATFPLAEPTLGALRTFVLHLTQQLLEANLQRHVFVHSWKLRAGATGQLVQSHLEAWQPRLGMGVWPDRDPPQPFNQESFMDMAADGILNKELPLPAHRLLHLEGTEDAVSDAVQQTFGSAALSLLFSKDGFAAIRAAGKKVYLPTIKASVYTHEKFYVPLFDTHSVAAASSPEALETWLCGVDVYLRESAEDGGLLIVTRLPMSALFAQAAKIAGISFVQLEKS